MINRTSKAYEVGFLVFYLYKLQLLIFKKMITNNLKYLVGIGYQKTCDELKALIMYRINTSAEEIFEDLFTASRGSVDNYCSKHSIDLASVLLEGNIEIKESIALSIIERQIKDGIREKADYDTEIKQLKISPIRITNGIELSPWLKLFNSPVSLQWWSKNTGRVLEQCNPSHPSYDKAVRVINFIRDNWVDAQNILPDLEVYHQLMAYEVPDGCRDLLTFPYGNS